MNKPNNPNNNTSPLNTDNTYKRYQSFSHYVSPPLLDTSNITSNSIVSTTPSLNKTTIKEFSLEVPLEERVCEHCNVLYTVKVTSKAKTCSDSCKFSKRVKLIDRVCEHCGIGFKGSLRARFCSDLCCANARLAKKNAGIEGVDYIKCPVCSSHVKQITVKHARTHGFKTTKEFKAHFNLAEVTCSKTKETNQGANNPGYQHGGKFSAWSVNFKNGYDANRHAAKNKQMSEQRKANPELYKSDLRYWLAEHNGDEVLAKAAYKLFQTRDLNFFVTKYGIEDGKKRHAAKTEKWMKSFKKTNFSMISQTLFDAIILQLDDLSSVYYATFQREDMSHYVNKEYILKVESTHVRPDFMLLDKKKIIEFDGDYWHSPAVANPARELLRDTRIKNEGYEILHITEREYKLDKQKVINECIAFLTK